MKGSLEDLNHFSSPSLPSSSSSKAGSLIYDMMGTTYWDKHSILALQELPNRTVAILRLRFWGEENLTNDPSLWRIRAASQLAREEDDRDKGSTDWESFFKISLCMEGKRNMVQVANPAACDLEDSCSWMCSQTVLYAGADLKASSSLPTPQSWHRFARDLFWICNVNTLSRGKMPALWATTTQLGNWFLNAFLL